MPALTANDIWRDFETAGVPASGAHKPVKADIRAWGTSLEAVGGFNVPGTDTTAALFSAGAGAAPVWRKIVGFDLPNPSTTTPGAVFAKPTVAGQVLTGLGADGEFETGAFTATNPNFTGGVSINGLPFIANVSGNHVFYSPEGRFGVQLTTTVNNYRANIHNFRNADASLSPISFNFNPNVNTLQILPPTLITGQSASAMNITQTWNTDQTVQGVEFRFISQAQGALSNAFRIRGGTDGLKNLFFITIGDPTNPAISMNGRTVFAAPDGNSNFIYSATGGVSFINAAGGSFLTLISNAGVWNFQGTTSGAHAVSAQAAASGASTFPNVSGELLNTGFGQVSTTIFAVVDFNAAAGTEYAVPIKLPAGVTRFRLGGAAFNTGPGAASLTTVQVAGYTATGAGGTAVFLPQGLTGITSNSPGVPGVYVNLTVNPAVGALHYFDIATVPTFYFRIVTPQGAAASGRLVLTVAPLA